MKGSYDATSKHIRTFTLATLAYLYIGAKPPFDYVIGKDSVWSRYIQRPVINCVINYISKDMPLETEEQFQKALEENKERANKQLADIIAMFP